MLDLKNMMLTIGKTLGYTGRENTDWTVIDLLTY